MGPDRIVMAPPAFDDDLSFVEGVEDLAIEQLIAKAGVEALDVAVLPRTAPLDIGSLGADRGDPSLDGLGDELRSIIRPDMTGDTPQDEEVNVARRLWRETRGLGQRPAPRPALPRPHAAAPSSNPTPKNEETNATATP